MISRVFHNSSFLWRQSLVERAVELDAIPLQAAQIGEFVVGLVLLPAAPKNAQPLEGDFAQRCPATLALAQGFLEQQVGPSTFGERTLGELDDALVQKDGAG